MSFSARGSASIYLITLIPIILATSFALYMIFGISESNLDLNQSCLREQIMIQENVKRSLRALLKLNVRAKNLRSQYSKAKRQLLIATASLNSPAITAARFKLSVIMSQRILLDLHQKSIIRVANIYLSSSQTRLKEKITLLALEKRKRFKIFVDYSVENLRSKKTELAIVADSDGPAPSYSLSQNFIEEQALELTWTLSTETQGVLGRFLPVSSRFNQFCSTAINNKEDEWPTVIRRANS